MKMRIHLIVMATILATFNLPFSIIHAQGTAFTYQGRLNTGANPANGIYDLRFAIYDAGTNGNQAGDSITNLATAATNGLFTATLDFGGIFTGTNYWLDIGVRTNGGAGFTELTPRQPITPAPYALFANTAGSVSGTISSGQLSGAIPLAELPSGVVTNGASGVNISGTFNGSGSGLTNLPGVFAWQTISGTNQQAVSGIGYIATNNCSQVAITLPLSANIGDIVRVSGAGASGWKIEQNSGQTVLAENLAGSINSAGTSWAARDSAQMWSCVASSADGTKLVAAVGGGLGIYTAGYPNTAGQIYTSSDSGATWMAQNSGNQPWQSLASSADGTKLVGACSGYGTGGDIFISTNSGVSWASCATPAITNIYDGGANEWSSVASSADGTKLVAAGYVSFFAASPYYGAIYTSTDSGVDWTVTSAPTNLYEWSSVASSADGTKLVAVNEGGPIYTSTDSGVTWAAQSSSALHWFSVASSADGTKLAAAVYNGPIYTSTNSGTNWTAQNSGNQNWVSLASSSDGTKLVAVVQNGLIYASNDSGVTWTRVYNINRNWQSVASSADGTKLVALADQDQIYTSDPTPVSATTTGTAGYLTGGQNTAVELQYLGNGQWMPISHEGNIYSN